MSRRKGEREMGKREREGGRKGVSAEGRERWGEGEVGKEREIERAWRDRKKKREERRMRKKEERERYPEIEWEIEKETYRQADEEKQIKMFFPYRGRDSLSPQAGNIHWGFSFE